ncbi:MerR family transcriptional regulator [Kribbella sandramycini]|uniref:DNA-binding transcriptional MerR regulator n=1 Tax=Kribbella sandramycini TaxID=60450 RepID=A0A7Y4L7T0_9ACTN|nr:MerR family transcriptional regulator [Kribbella sandramycini]MBB6567159.1 DNA-binding transcriptional MerR regulator [Kribbella sandramycini]NOL44876.1 MerR family transcriptional regulator [Kribbella sandramycini]
MRITEAAKRLGTTPRMLRYRETLGLLPHSRAGSQRQYDERDLAAVQLALDLERRYDVTPAALAFALRALAEPSVAADLRNLGYRTGKLTTPPTQSQIDRERALQWLGRSGVLPPKPR